jgi:hypothetical protein
MRDTTPRWNTLIACLIKAPICSTLAANRPARAPPMSRSRTRSSGSCRCLKRCAHPVCHCRSTPANRKSCARHWRPERRSSTTCVRCRPKERSLKPCGPTAASCSCTCVVRRARCRKRHRYADVTQEVAEFLGERLAATRAAGIDAKRLVIDPGFGFGKTVEHNFTLLRELGRLTGLGAPLAVGLSRKSMLGAVSGRPVDERLHASVAAAVLALERGARLLRVHDVAATRDAVRVWQAMGNDVEQGEQA